MQFEVNSWVWITDESERYLPAQALVSFVKGCATTVLVEGCYERNLDAEDSSQVQECHPEALDPSICDLISISNLNEMAILHNLRSRYRKDAIYTNISSILISVNPLKHLPLYTTSMLADYRDGIKDKDPHIFAVAYSAYHNLLMREGDQSVVCSGESGAGKSEATKLILQFLADVSTRSASRHGGVNHGASSSLESEVLAANPILEAFGNAKTLRNNNSSRFGKLITINFDHNGSIIGGGIINYLLEKSRVVSQGHGERNYHIFYQLLSSVNSKASVVSEELKLQGGPESFAYTNKTSSTIEGVSDEKDFEEVLRSLDILGFTEEEKKEVLKIIAGILHFGNVKFEGKHEKNEDETASIVSTDIVEFACSLWGIDKSAMEVSLCSRSMGTRDNIMVKYNVSQAQDARDAMTKRVYAELFQLVVDKINNELGGAKYGRHRFIGILDIFGFESFEVNSFEQLCINYCNEKLQFHFNEHIFRMEQALYESEGVAIEGIQFIDNQATLDLLEARNTGIFSLCDEEISMPRGSDETFLQKIFSRHGDGKHPSCIRPKTKDCKDSIKNFGVTHYAGPVYYNVTCFLEKNKDQLHSDILNALRASSSTFVQRMFPTKTEQEFSASSRQSGRAGTSALKTLGGQFKQQLNDLIVTLNQTFPHFVRCMKPNDDKLPDQFDSNRMQDQLRYAGLLEVCRIRKLGYPIRRPFQEFYRRYRCCDISCCSSIDDVLKLLADKGVLVPGEWAKGKTRVFMRNEQAVILEEFREKALFKYVSKIQNIGRGLVARVRRRKCLTLIGDLKSSIEVREEGGLDYYLQLCHLIPHGGVHLQVVQSARELLARVIEEKRVTLELRNAVSSKLLQALKTSTASAASMDPPFRSSLVEEALALAARLEIETAAARRLADALSSRDQHLLAAAISHCEEAKYDCDDLQIARKLLIEVKIETEVLGVLEEAVNRRDVEDIELALQKCYDAHLSALQQVANARELKERIVRERKESSSNEMTAVLRKAIADRSSKALNDALDFVALRESSGLISADKNILSEARNLLIELDVAEVKIALSAATASQDVDALSKAIASAERLGLGTTTTTTGSCQELDLAADAKRQLDKSRIKDRLKARIMGKKTTTTDL